MKYLHFREINEALTFDDVLLVPGLSAVKSRSDVNTVTEFCGMDLDIPVLTAPMDTVTGIDMALAARKGGGLGILHRYMDPGVVLGALRTDRKAIVPSVGVQSEDLDKALIYVDAGAEFISVDIAHGHSELMRDFIVKLKRARPWVRVIAGNVATAEGFDYLAEAGADAVRCGVGSGSICETRLQTGHGVPQLSAIADVVYNSTCTKDAYIISDGGIRHIGDIAKAIAVGADVVMTGFLFAGCNETPNPTMYSGMASKRVQLEYRGKVSNVTPEGVHFDIKPTGRSAVEVLAEIRGGLRSACSYSGAVDLDELAIKARFIRVSGASVAENGVRSK